MALVHGQCAIFPTFPVQECFPQRSKTLTVYPYDNLNSYNSIPSLLKFIVDLRFCITFLACLPTQVSSKVMWHVKKQDPELTPILGDASSGASKSLVSTAPHPGPISRRTRVLLVICILFTELCERLTFYGIVANLVLYCRDYLKLQSPLPSSISLAFQGNWCFWH